MLESRMPLLVTMLKDKDTHGRAGIPARILKLIDERVAPSSQYGKYYVRPPKKGKKAEKKRGEVSVDLIAQMIHSLQIEDATWETEKGKSWVTI